MRLPTIKRRFRLPPIAAVAIAWLTIGGATVWSESAIRFAQHIQPILATRCYRCHGLTVQKANLNLATVTGIQQGSESGRIIDAGNPDDSRLFQVVDDGEMPPEDEDTPLSAEQVELIRKWIAEGAPFDVPSSGSQTRSQPARRVADLVAALRRVSRSTKSRGWP